MTISYSPVGSVLNEQPPANHKRPNHQPLDHNQAFAGPSDTVVPMARRRSAPPPSIEYSPATPSLLEPPDRSAVTPMARGASDIGGDFEVVYDNADGYPLLAFADGHWFDVTSLSPRPVSLRYALRLDPAWAGAVVQTSCLWMRSNPNDERSFDLATELSLTVGELIRQS